MTNKALDDVVAAVKPALQTASTTTEEREKFLYDVVREVHGYVREYVIGMDATDDERERLGRLADDLNGS